MGEWVIGAFINLFGSIAINFGTNLLKLGHNEVCRLHFVTIDLRSLTKHFSITEKFTGFNAAQACYDIYIIQSTVFVASSIIICISLWYEFTVKMNWTDFRLT